MTEWNPPGLGPWQQDSAHNPTSQSLSMQEVYAPGFNRGFTETFSRYGLLLDRLAMGVVNGFTYHQPQPFDMPGPDGPMSPDALHAEFGRRLGVAAAMFESELWQQDLADWDDEWKPNAIARHRQLSDVSLPDLDDAALGEHLAAAAAHVVGRWDRARMGQGWGDGTQHSTGLGSTTSQCRTHHDPIRRPPAVV